MGAEEQEGRLPEAAVESEAGEPSGESVTVASGALAEALEGLLRIAVRRGRQEFSRVATDGRARLELRQLRKDRDAMYRKLGKEVRTLVEGGEVAHPGLVRGVERIAELDARVAEGEVGGPPAGEE